MAYPVGKHPYVLMLNGKPVAGFSEVGGLGMDTNVVEYREGNGKHTQLTLKGGVAYDPAFTAWAAQRGVRRHLTLHVYNRAGRLVRSHQLTGATNTVVEIAGSLDPGANPIQLQHIKLENEGWTR
jgi:phage tail-like protein